jgi:alpha-ketoglutarate-dependent taurine dioxygenase
MTDLRTAAQQALEAMDKATRYMSDSDYRNLNEAITALRAALAEPKQAPVAWLWEHQVQDLKHYGYKPDMRAWTTEGRRGNFERLVPVFTCPPRGERQGLTDTEQAYAKVEDV